MELSVLRRFHGWLRKPKNAPDTYSYAMFLNRSTDLYVPMEFVHFHSWGM